MTDVVGYPNIVNSLASTKTTLEGSTITGDLSDRFGTLIWEAYPSIFNSGSGGYLAIPNPDFSDQAAFNHAVAISNPSRPEVLTGAFLFELRDLPKLYHLAAGIENFLQGIGRISKFNHQIDGAVSAEWVLQQLKPSLGNGIHHSRKLAVANLTIQFGIVPMIADIKSMLDVAMNFERRRREINQLYSGRGLRRKVNIGSPKIVESSVFTTLYSSEGLIFQTSVLKKSWRKTWVTLRWKPNNPSTLPPLDVELWRTMMGLTPSHILSTAWELLPWTWFMDYFSNTGDVIGGLTNSMNAHLVMGALMHETRQSQHHDSVTVTKSSGKSVVLSAGRASRHTKLRTPMNLVSAAPTLPIISANQLSILSSLVLKGI